jgi:hypothetical protein
MYLRRDLSCVSLLAFVSETLLEIRRSRQAGATMSPYQGSVRERALPRGWFKVLAGQLGHFHGSTLMF